jgi:hypothetical protein
MNEYVVEGDFGFNKIGDFLDKINNKIDKDKDALA